MTRGNWHRSTAALELSEKEIACLIAPVFPRASIVRCEQTEGGLANTNIRVILCEPERSVRLRVYQRDGSQAAKERSISQLISGKVPCAEVFHYSQTNSVNGLPYMILEWIEGYRLESAVQDLDAQGILAVPTFCSEGPRRAGGWQLFSTGSSPSAALPSLISATFCALRSAQSMDSTLVCMTVTHAPAAFFRVIGDIRAVWLI